MNSIYMGKRIHWKNVAEKNIILYKWSSVKPVIGKYLEAGWLQYKLHI